MTRLTTVLPSGLVDLGDRARELGFTRGAVVEVIPTSAGSLLVVLDHSPPTYDATWKPLVGAAAHRNRSRALPSVCKDPVEPSTSSG